MSQYIFGSGVLWGVPTIALDGTAITTPTPVPFGALQDVSVDIAFSKKELYGQYQFALAIGRGTGKIEGKAKAAQFQASLFNLVFGETPATGETKAAFNEAGTVANNAITVANNGTFLTDLGVRYSANGIPLTRGANASGAGVYSVANGVYTFHANDANAAMKLSYAYSSNAAPGQVITINNHLIGESLYFKAILYAKYEGKQLTLTLNKCSASKLSMATKLEDWAVPEFDFSAMADSSGVVGAVSVAEP